MARKLISLEEKEKINELIQGKDYIIYCLSSMQIGKDAVPEFLWNNLEEVLEARFFDEQKELHIYDFEGSLKASLFCEEGDEEYMEETQYIREKGMREILIRKYISYEEAFGQAYIRDMRPVRVIRQGE